MSGWGLAAPGAAVALGMAAAVTLFLAGWRREARKGHRRGRGTRLSLLALSLLSLLTLALRPLAPGSGGPARILLLTPGAEGIVDDDEVPIFSLVTGTPGERIGDLGELTRRWPEVRRVDVAGYGLPEWAWRGSGLELGDFRPPPLPPGIHSLRWPRRVAVGEELEVWGEVAVGAQAHLKWSGPGGELATRQLSPGLSSFYFRDRPRAAGRLLYRLALETPAGLEEAVVDAVAAPPSPPRVLWLESAPDFESRELRAWYRRLGGEITVRTRVSRDRYRLDAVNRPAVEPWPLGGGTPRQLDLVVVDREAWSDLGRARREGVARAVRETGLGLLLRLGADEAPPRDDLFGGFRVSAVGDVERMEVRVLGDGFASRERLRTAARQLDAEGGLFPLLTDTAGRVLAARETRGQGAVGLSLLGATHRWRLAGAAEDHAGAWTVLFEALGRPGGEGRLTLPEGPIWIGEPLSVDWRGPGGPPAVAVEGPDGLVEPLGFRQKGAGETAWSAIYRPRGHGWHSVADSGGASVEFRAVERQALPAVRAARAVAATRARAVLGRPDGDSEGGRSTGREPRPVPRRGLFLTWLLVSGWLWVEERRSTPGSRA